MNPDSLQLRAVHASEANLVRSMAERIWPEAYGSILEPRQITYMLDWMYSPETIRMEIEEKNILYFWLENSSENIGFLSIGPGETAKTILLHKLYLLSQFQGKGFARQALHLLVAHQCCAHAKTLELRVNRHNEKAIAFYTRQGFTILREDVAEIGGGFQMDDFIMQRNLIPSGGECHPQARQKLPRQSLQQPRQ